MSILEYFPCEAIENECDMLHVEDIKRIYGNIMDEYSKSIFENRFMYSLTGDYEYIRKIVLNTKTGKRLNELLSGEMYIYGAGRRGKSLVEIFVDKDWRGFIDASKEGEYEGYPVCKFCNFEYKEGTTIIISNKIGYDVIREDLISNKKCPENKIIVLQNFYEQIIQSIYLETEYLKDVSMHNKIFMDLGCYDGKDAIRAIKYFDREDIKVCALEPDNENYEVCVDNLQQFPQITLVNCGIGGKKEVKRFAEGGVGARFSESGNVEVKIDTIDNLAGKSEVGLIKMDIEGYEEEALIGGTETIRRCKPVLAICVYHKRSDIWRLPRRILDINPDYRFYLGHYTLEWGDTVLYAIAKN